IRVLSPRIEPPDTVDEGSIASTATRCPLAMRNRPSASTKVLLPTPGTPEMPRRKDLPLWGSNSVSSASARARWSPRVDSSSVIALAMARRCAAPGSPVMACARFTAARPHPQPLRRGEGATARNRPCSRLRDCLLDLLQHVLGAGWDRGAGAVDALDARVVEELVV